MPKTQEERFMQFVSPEPTSGCWLWAGCVFSGTGYGRFYIGNRGVSAHRESYRMFVGPISGGMSVCHRCDNPMCVNPAHLFLGTALDNARDAAAKRRMRRGETHPMSKLTDSDVLDIRAALEGGRGPKSISKQLGVNRTTIRDIRRGNTWTHVIRRPG